MAYNDILNHLERKENNTHTVEWHFWKILRHQHTPRGNRDRINSDYNVDILWETGAITTESIKDLASEFKVNLALYGKEDNLLQEECWKQFKHVADREKHIICLANQAQLWSFRVAAKYKYGLEVPKDYRRGLELDKIVSNNKWRDTNILEHKKLAEYKVFQDRGQFYKNKVFKDYQLISIHTIYDVKHEGRHRSRVSANLHLTDVSLESAYSGVVSL